jgi:DNA repair exonuclease SbcCD ATPase subunit
MAAAEVELLRLREEVKVLRSQAACREDEGKVVDSGQEDQLRRFAEDCETQMKEAQRETADLRKRLHATEQAAPDAAAAAAAAAASAAAAAAATEVSGEAGPVAEKLEIEEAPGDSTRQVQSRREDAAGKDGTSTTDKDHQGGKTRVHAGETLDNEIDSLRAQLSEAQYEIVQTRRLVDTLRADCEREGAMRQEVEREAAQERERLNLEIERLMQQVASIKVGSAINEYTPEVEAEVEALRNEVEALRRAAEELGRVHANVLEELEQLRAEAKYLEAERDELIAQADIAGAADAEEVEGLKRLLDEEGRKVADLQECLREAETQEGADSCAPEVEGLRRLAQKLTEEVQGLHLQVRIERGKTDELQGQMQTMQRALEARAAVIAAPQSGMHAREGAEKVVVVEGDFYSKQKQRGGGQRGGENHAVDHAVQLGAGLGGVIAAITECMGEMKLVADALESGQRSHRRQLILKSPLYSDLNSKCIRALTFENLCNRLASRVREAEEAAGGSREQVEVGLEKVRELTELLEEERREVEDRGRTLSELREEVEKGRSRTIEFESQVAELKRAEEEAKAGAAPVLTVDGAARTHPRTSEELTAVKTELETAQHTQETLRNELMEAKKRVDDEKRKAHHEAKILKSPV